MVSRFVGAAIGVAVIGSIFAAIQSHHLDTGGSTGLAFDAGGAGTGRRRASRSAAATWAWFALRGRSAARSAAR